MNWTIETLYEWALKDSIDIKEHLPTLLGLAVECDHITEFGMRQGFSTAAMLRGIPETLISYDFNPNLGYAIEPMKEGAAAAGIDYKFILGDSRTVDIESTDLLFIDTMHDYNCLSVELARHHDKVRKMIVMHDTATFGDVGGDGLRGMTQAINEFLAVHPEWYIWSHSTNNHGLTVMWRKA